MDVLRTGCSMLGTLEPEGTFALKARSTAYSMSQSSPPGP